MIARLLGSIWECNFSRVVLNVNNVGYELQIPLSTYEQIAGETGLVELQVYTQVREDAMVLFGFASDDEKRLFELLLGVNGIGGKLALAILSGLPVSSFCHAVSSKNVASLSKISGVGKRTAERLVVELHDKVTGFGSSSEPHLSSNGATSQAVNDAALALEQLGFKREVSIKTLKSLAESMPEDQQTTENLLRLGLQALNP